MEERRRRGSAVYLGWRIAGGEREVLAGRVRFMGEREGGFWGEFGRADGDVEKRHLRISSRIFFSVFVSADNERDLNMDKCGRGSVRLLTPMSESPNSCNLNLYVEFK